MRVPGRAPGERKSRSGVCFELVQGFAKLRRKQDGRARDGNDVRDRLGQIHGRRLVGQQRRQQIDQRRSSTNLRSTATMIEHTALPMDTNVIWQAIWMPNWNRPAQ